MFCSFFIEASEVSARAAGGDPYGVQREVRGGREVGAPLRCHAEL